MRAERAPRIVGSVEGTAASDPQGGVETAHGAIEALAWLHAGIRPDAVFVPIGWGERQPYHPWRSVNFLTDKNQRDPVSDQTNLKALLCRVSRAPSTRIGKATRNPTANAR